jgi:hypothetical protein
MSIPGIVIRRFTLTSIERDFGDAALEQLQGLRLAIILCKMAHDRSTFVVRQFLCKHPGPPLSAK